MNRYQRRARRWRHRFRAPAARRAREAQRQAERIGPATLWGGCYEHEHPSAGCADCEAVLESRT